VKQALADHSDLAEVWKPTLMRSPPWSLHKHSPVQSCQPHSFFFSFGDIGI
jgi:hypothetical protein